MAEDSGLSHCGRFVPLGRKPTYAEFLQYRYNTTVEKERAVLLATGSYRDFQRAMEWFHYKYDLELELIEQLSAACPFL